MIKTEASEKGIQFTRDKVLVDWDIKFTEDQDGTAKPEVMVTFSRERAATQMGDVQGEHASAHALGVMLVMQILKNFIPVEKNKFTGITKLTNEMRIVKRRDEYFLKRFGIKYTPSRLLDGLRGEVGAEQTFFNNTIDALSQVVSQVEASNRLPLESLAAAPEDARAVLNGLKEIKTRLLYSQKLAIRRDYCMRVSTLAAKRLLEYLNAAPFTAFKRIEKQGDEADYEKGEGARVRKALAYLQNYTKLPVELVVDVQVAEADAENLRKPRRPVRATVAAKRLAEEQEKIVYAMCDLLHYPQVDEAKEKSPTKRTNDSNVLTFVLARHIAILFVTFNGLEGRADRQDIMDEFIARKLDKAEWPILSEAQRTKITGDITSALKSWDKDQGKIREAMEEEYDSATSSFRGGRLSLKASPSDSKHKLSLSSNEALSEEVLGQQQRSRSLLLSKSSQTATMASQSSQQQEEDELSQKFPSAKLKE